MLFPTPLLLAPLFAAPSYAQRPMHEGPIEGFREILLRELPPIDLREADGPPPAICNVRDFCLLDEHRLAILRFDETLLVVTDRGELLRELSLPQVDLPLGPLRVRLRNFSDLARTGPDRILLAPDRAWNEGPLRVTGLLEIDLAKGTLRIPALVPRSESGLSIAGSPSGEMALLVHPDKDSTQLYVLDPDGSLAWSRTQRICSGHSLCFTSSGQLALLDAGQSAVQRFRWHGWWSTYTHIGGPSGEPFQPFSIESTTSAGFLFLGASGGDSAIVRTDEDLEFRQTFEPRHSDGTPIQQALHASPTGRIWASDGWSISRLGPDGIAEFTLGVRPEEHKLGEARAVHIARSDTIHAIARRDGAVHEFDPSGRSVHVTPMPAGPARERSRDCSPPGFEGLFTWRLRATVGERTWAQEWNGNQETLRLLDASGSALMQQPLEADERIAGPAADGSLVLVRPGREERDGLARRLDLQGAELVRWPLTGLPAYFESVDFDGRTLAIALPDQVLAWHADGTRWLSLPIPYSCSHEGCGMASSRCWQVHLARDGRELWLRRGPEATKIERYALP